MCWVRESACVGITKINENIGERCFWLNRKMVYTHKTFKRL